jgi:hypothetical protein
MPISITCQCGKKLGVPDEMAGKKVKCPACQSIVNVPGGAAASEVAAGKPKAKAAAEDDGDEGPAPKKKARGNGDEKKSSKTMMYVGIGAGLLLVGCCCLGVAGGGGWFFFFRSSPPEKVIIGKWQGDPEAIKKANPKDELSAGLAAAFNVEFKADGTMTTTVLGMSKPGKWKHISTKSDVVTIEIDEGKKTEKQDIKVIDNNHIQLFSGKKGEPDMFMKRL